MARTTLVVTEVDPDGAYVAPVVGTVDGHMFVNDGKTWLEVTNASGATRAVTFTPGGTREGYSFDAVTRNLTASQVLHFGPFPTEVFNQRTGADKGKVYVNFTAGQEASLSVAAYKLER